MTWTDPLDGELRLPITSGYQTNTCYRYTLSLTNGAGLSATASSGNLLVTLAPPPSPSGRPPRRCWRHRPQRQLDQHHHLDRERWRRGGGGITNQEANQQSGPVVTPGTCSGVTWTTRWTQSYTSPFTTTGYQTNTCYRYTLSLTNGAGSDRDRELGQPAGQHRPAAEPVGHVHLAGPGATVTSTSGTNTITWSESDGGTGGGGITSRRLTQQSGPVVTPGTCFGVTWTTRWTASYTSPFTTSGYASGTCYRYTLSLTNGAGVTATATSGNLLVSLPPPPSPSATFTSPALGDTVISTSSTNTFTWTESDGGGGGITSRKLTQQSGPVVTVGTCAGVTWTTGWTKTFTSPFTTGGYKAGYCYRYTLVITNGAGGTATASSGFLLVAKKN